MQKYNQIVNSPVPQSQQQYPEQVPNNAGGWAFKVDHWTQLSRFLVLGTVGGTYYVGERDLTMLNLEAVDQCIAEDPGRVASEALNVSVAGRALKNDPAIFVLAKMAVSGVEAKRLALETLQAVCRIPTHLFHFMAYYDGLGGKWGRQLRTAVGKWYTGHEAKNLMYHLVKYQSRDGWSNKDLIKLSHPAAINPDQHYLFARELGNVGDKIPSDEVRNYISAVDLMHSPTPSLAGKVELITRHNLPREVIPTELLNERTVWEAMLPKMPITALIRNLGKLTSLGVIGPMSQHNGTVIAKLTSQDAITRGRVHPLQLLIASKVYEAGAGYRGSLTWRPETMILGALQEAFYKAFGNVQPTGLRTLFALDESGSMRNNVSGDVPMLNCAEAGAAVLCILNSVEPHCVTVNFATRLRRVHHDKHSRINDVMREYAGTGEGTDCSVPIKYALAQGIPVDIFVMFTDSETWAGSTHPEYALREYRKATGLNSKVVVCAATANNVSIFAKDPLSLAVPGFDAALPQIIREFAII